MSFVGKFFLLVVGLGFAELWLLVNVASGIGFLKTLGLCILTGVVGGALVRHQGLRTLQEIQGAVGRGEMPAVQIVSGLVLLIVGALLIVPGFITDILGFAMLVPGLRGLAAGRLARSLEGRVSRFGAGMGGGFGAGGFGPGGFGPGGFGPGGFGAEEGQRPEQGPVIIDVEAEEQAEAPPASDSGHAEGKRISGRKKRSSN